MFRAAIATILCLSCANYAHADGAITRLITKSDQARLDKYEETRNKALDEARKGGAAADVQVLNATLAKANLTFSEDFNMTGDWKCRTTKLGNEPPLTVYDWFDCRVIDDGSGWVLEKTSGSQRTKGRFYTDSDNRLTYLGVGYIAGQKPKAYSAGPDNDQVGYAYRTGSNEFRIEFPAPALESLMDILELKR
ncbi:MULTISPECIES: DUF4893 domain-containing protein [Phyllobacterium]|jgi:hypothetical protein|uniref:DUF4893 domain-containing protein n=1 Tax=Phyllobacterium sophorae TaxID=1520277 RepID=A0A2P7BHL1_9HYPH|nr:MULTISPECIES: DUF4893 domain-containing protein [Phyllobacterium]PSH65970.1 DUF4893 domain-containing protein [Phyllobacterium sophorae]UXN64520.1 DUF4893 domain-containing protein [Phyllobacterium sp. A18/5-2]